MAIDALLPGVVASHPFLTIFALITVPLLGTLLYDVQQWMRMPPGPTPLPFVGNKYLIPKSKPWIQFKKWSDEYGPIFTLWIGRKPTVIISDPAIAIDLLEKRGNKYASRPRMIAMGEIYNNNASILVQPYGKEWTIRRKLLHYAMTPKALRLYKPIQEAEASRLCYQLLHDPANYEKLIERFTSSIVFCVAYGHRIDSLKAEVIRQRFDFMHFQASLNVPGKYAVETMPFLKYVPNALAPWKKEIQAKGAAEGRANLELLQMVKDDLARNGKANVPDSLCKLLLEVRETEPIPLTETEFSYIPASLFGAGSDTTASTLCTAVLALITHPATLKRAQMELDTVIGDSRTPTFADEASLPYIRALVKEVLRWRPVAVLGGTPRSTTAPDDYEGYHIPLDTSVLSNFWAINLNEEYYPNPHRFDPVRFLSLTSSTPLGDEDQKAAVQYQGPKSYPGKTGENVFGVGRRICPGANLAENSLYIALSKLLWAYDILPIEGMHYDTFDYTEGFNIRPKPFKCRISVRSEAHRRVLEREEKDAEAFLEKFTPFGE
ncbi:hypothetical protein H2203_002742 [Taxawa tesnikishii (nom. ined.)]|nr:hypothetical protein H2203_002742 [Dothideales sp. JES 119]